MNNLKEMLLKNMKKWSLSEKAYKLRKKYKNKYNDQPRGWSWEEETMKEYEAFLEEELRRIRLKV